MENLQASTQKQLRAFIEALETIDEERKEAVEAFSEKLKEAKGVGFDPKIIRKVLKMRKMSQAEREEEEALYVLYARATGLLGTPLGDFADRQSEPALANV